MSSILLKKRKSCDTTEIHNMQHKNDRWYEQELENTRVKEKPKPEKRRLSFIGNFLGKMKSSSKITEPKEERVSSSRDSSFHCPSDSSVMYSVSSVDSVPDAVKRNAELKKFLEKCGDSVEAISFTTSEDSAQSIGSAGSLDTPVRPHPNLCRGSENRGSSRSMPSSTPRNDTEKVVKRAHSISTGSHESPSWLRRKSLRLRGRKVEQEMAELKEEEENDVDMQPMTSLDLGTPCSEMVNPTPRVDRSKSAVGALVTRKRASFLQKKGDEFTCTPEDRPRLKKNTPGGSSSSTIQKFGAAIRRGLSSGSRQTTPVSSNISTTAEALVTVQRRPTGDIERSSHPLARSRRMSDIANYSDLSMATTPRTFDQSSRFQFEADEASKFSTKVKVCDNWELMVKEVDAVVIDVTADGKPGTSFSQAYTQKFGGMDKVADAVRADPQKKAGVISFEGRSSSPTIVYVVQRDADIARQIRHGYEAALESVFKKQDIRNILLPVLFCSESDFTSAYADAIVRTTFRLFSREANSDKVDSIHLTGTDAVSSALLVGSLQMVVNEKLHRSAAPQI